MAFQIPSQWGPQEKNPIFLNPWTRPADWPSITDAAGEVQFLVCDSGSLIYAIKTAFTKPGSQNLYIDWGDGVTNTISTNTDVWTTHTYTLGAGTPCTLGYTTWKIRVYTDSGATIDTCLFDVNTASPVVPYQVNVYQPVCGVLEAYYGDGTVPNTMVGSFITANRGFNFIYLQYVKFPSSVTSSTATYLNTCFSAAYKLAKVILPTNVGTSNNKSLDSLFLNCISLEEITLPAIGNIGDLAASFQNCYNLSSVTIPETLNFSTCTSLSNAFNSCFSLSSKVKLPSLSSCTTFSTSFANCYSLQEVEIAGFISTASTVTVTNTFQNCFALRNVRLPRTVTAGSTFNTTTANGMFLACRSLPGITMPENFDGSLFAIFKDCSNLSYVKFPGTVSNSSSWAQAFNNDHNLQEVVFPENTTASVDFTSALANCRILQSVTIPASWNLSNISGSFIAAYTLKNVNILGESKPLLSNISSTFQNCYSLESFAFPSTISSGTITGQVTFSACVNLKQVTLPAVMNLNSMSTMFSSCFTLRSITLPVSMSSCTAFSGTFQSCDSLLSIVLPATTGNVSDYSSIVKNALNVKSITFPTSPSNGSISNLGMIGVFSGASNLRTINNIDSIKETPGSIFLEWNDTNAATSNLWGTFYISSTLDLYSRLSKFWAGGRASLFASFGVNRFSGLRLRSTLINQWGGTSPQISIAYTNMSTSAIIDLFNDLALQPNVSGKTIDITSAAGAAGLTAGDRAIVTAKGWTITG